MTPGQKPAINNWQSTIQLCDLGVRSTRKDQQPIANCHLLIAHMGVIQGEIDIYGVLERLEKMPQQRQFISAAQPNAAYVGGQGSGKSIALCATAILNAIDDPNGYSLIGRLNMPALETTTMKTFLELVPEGVGDWLVSKKMFRFSNGHEMIFRHLDITEPKIEGHIKSLNLSAAYVDEATEISQDVYNLLIGRIRRKTAKRRIMRLASNPAGHDWVWRHFFDPKRKPELVSSNLGITASTMEFSARVDISSAIIRLSFGDIRFYFACSVGSGKAAVKTQNIGSHSLCWERPTLQGGLRGVNKFAPVSWQQLRKMLTQAARSVRFVNASLANE